MAEFALLNFSGESGKPVPGIKVGEYVLDIALALRLAPIEAADFSAETTKDILRGWDKAENILDKLADAFLAKKTKALVDSAKPLSSVKLLAPILYPDAIFGAFANFTDHMNEMSGRTPPDKTKVKPYFFPKLTAHCVIGPEEPVRLPTHSDKGDWEVELAVVIGRPARNVPVEKGMYYVAGYTIMNDLTLRDQGKRGDWNIGHDFIAAKSFDSAAPMGPWIIPAKQIPDPYNLTMKQWVSEDLLQDSNSSYMHFTIPEQIAFLSSKVTLRPGDIISTGSPSGNGRPRGIFLKPGQELTAEIEKIGRLHNPVVRGT